MTRALEHNLPSVKEQDPTGVLPSYTRQETPTSMSAAAVNLRDDEKVAFDNIKESFLKMKPANREASKSHIESFEKAVADAAQGEGLIVTSTADAITVHHALTAFAAIGLDVKYGKEARQRAISKAQTQSDVTIEANRPNATQAYRYYDRFRIGAVTKEPFNPLTAKSDDSVFPEAPIHQVDSESLQYTREESEVVFDALRLMTLVPKRPGDDLAAMDVLSRSAPKPSERTFYHNLMEKSGVHLDVKAMPEYPTAASR